MKKVFGLLLIIILVLTGCSKEPTSYIVYFNKNNETSHGVNVVEKGNFVIEPLDPTNGELVFLGWYTDNELTNEYSFGVTVLKDFTLYAKWGTELEPVLFEIIFESNGGSNIGNTSMSTGEYDGDLPIPTKLRYIFEGWFTDEELTHEIMSGLILSSETIFYAKWSYEEVVLDDLPYSEYFSDTNPVITIEIENFGTIIIELFPDVAPNTVNNFIMYIENGDFSDNSFHRVIEDFMIQGGNTYSTECPIKGDFSSNGVLNDLSHYRGTISMARTSVVDSATSQFFIVHENSYFLDGNYATFGGIIDGFDVLDAIAWVDTFYSDAPKEAVVITSISVSLNGYVSETTVCAN